MLERADCVQRVEHAAGAVQVFRVAGYQETLGCAKTAELAGLCFAESAQHLLEPRVGDSQSAHGVLVRAGTLDQSPDGREMTGLSLRVATIPA